MRVACTAATTGPSVTYQIFVYAVWIAERMSWKPEKYQYYQEGPLWRSLKSFKTKLYNFIPIKSCLSLTFRLSSISETIHQGSAERHEGPSTTWHGAWVVSHDQARHDQASMTRRTTTVNIFDLAQCATKLDLPRHDRAQGRAADRCYIQSKRKRYHGING